MEVLLQEITVHDVVEWGGIVVIMLLKKNWENPLSAGTSDVVLKKKKKTRNSQTKILFSSLVIMTCQGFLQCTLKLLNFLVALVGAYMILYSLWMFKEWQSDITSSHLATPSSSPNPLLSDGNNLLLGDGNFNILTSLSLQQATDIIPMQQPLGRPFLSSGKKSTVSLSDLPKPWLVLFFLFEKILLCCIWLQIHCQSVGHLVFQIFPQLWLVHFLFENSCSGKIRACGCVCFCIVSTFL